MNNKTEQEALSGLMLPRKVGVMTLGRRLYTKELNVVAEYVQKARLSTLDKIGAPKFNDLPFIPTPEEYEKMLWMMEWYKRRIDQLRKEIG